jgi:hypothetical protein
MAQMCKENLENPTEYFDTQDQMGYYKAKFLAHIAPKLTPDQTLFTKHEWIKYQDGIEKLKKWEELFDFIKNMQDIHNELKKLYIVVSLQGITWNIANRPEETSHFHEENVALALTKYAKLVKDLDAYPEWQTKVRDEVGYFAHTLYNAGVQDKHVQEIFSEFDKQYFFK